jgi:hypothetical protein
LPIYAGYGLRGYHNNYTRFATTKETIMQTTSEQLTEMHQTARQLIKTLELTEARHDRAMRRYRLHWLVIITLAVAVLYMSTGSGPTAFAQTEPQ